MDPEEMAAIAAQKAETEKQMKQIMAEYGAADEGVDDDMAAMMKNMGVEVKGNSEEDDIMAKIAKQANADPEDMTDDALLAELAGEVVPEKTPVERATQLKQSVDQLLVEIKSLMGQGKKAEAAAKLRERKAAEVELGEIYGKDPGIKVQVESPAASVQKEQKPTTQPKLSLSILEIYEKYHDPELIQSVATIDAEVQRCNSILPQLDGELQQAMTDRIEILEMQKESIESDIQNEFLDVAGYLDQIQQYQQEESANLKKAKADGLDEENLELIQGRISSVKQEIAEVSQGLQQMEEAEEENQIIEQSERVEPQPVEAQESQQEAPQEIQEAQPVSLASIDTGLFNLIMTRKSKYAIAARYCKSELANNDLLMRCIESAERCGKVANIYKSTGKIEKGILGTDLTPEKLFGMSAADKVAKFDEIIAEMEKNMTTLHDTARKCLDGSKKVKKQAEIAALRTMAGTKINEAKAVKEKVMVLKAQRENPWSAPPEVQKVTTTKAVSKINEDLEANQFEIEIPESDSLVALNLKSVKIKIKNKENQDILEHFFKPEAGSDCKAKLQIPESIKDSFKAQKLMIACKAEKNVFFEENLHKTDFALTKLAQNNEIKKEVKFAKTRFEVIVRIRQAVFKKETVAEENTAIALKKLYAPFDEFEKNLSLQRSQVAQPVQAKPAQPIQPAKAPQAKPVAVPQVAPQKQVAQQAVQQQAAAPVAPSTPLVKLNPADIADVENESLLVCASYCEQRINEINDNLAKCMKNQVRADPKERQVLRLAMRSKNVIETGCQGGQISIEEYDKMLLGLMKRDQALAQHFNKIKNPENQKKMDICMARFKCAKAERAELAPHLAK